MNEDPSRSLVPRPGGVFDSIGQRLKLLVRLLKDRRVNPLIKLLPIGSLLYLLIPDLAPGPIDDAAILWIGSYLFVELCPDEVVAEHQRELASTIDGEWRELGEDSEEEPLEG
ncbi:MAG TPA: hypothetical protein VGA52_08035 [Anaerolineales bacterium]